MVFNKIEDIVKQQETYIDGLRAEVGSIKIVVFIKPKKQNLKISFNRSKTTTQVLKFSSFSFIILLGIGMVFF